MQSDIKSWFWAGYNYSFGS